MYVKNQTPEPVKYLAPDCLACETEACAIICASGDIDDWNYDNDGRI